MDRANAAIRARNQARLSGGGGSYSRGGGMTPAARSAFSRAIAQYQPGGGFGKGVEAALGRSRTKAMASGMQSLVSSGLSGTTTAAGLGKKFEEEVGMPTRMGVEEARAGNLSRLYASFAGMEQSGFESAQSRMPRFTGGGGGGSPRRPTGGGVPSYGPSWLYNSRGGGGGRGGSTLQKTGGSQALRSEWTTV